jgi:hypothetical protein
VWLLRAGFGSAGDAHGSVDIASGTGVRDHFAWVSKDDRFGRDVEVDKRSRSDERLASYSHFSNDNRVSANPYAIFKRGCACALPSAFGADGGDFCNVDIGTNR